MGEMPDNIVPLTPKAVSAMEEFLAEHERELLTILFTDLVDSTQLQSDLGNAEAARLVQLHRRILREELGKHNSREVEWAGDSCLAVFSMPSDGVRFALSMQAAMRKAKEAEPNLPHVRVGLHLGEIFVHKGQQGTNRSEELFGLQVSETARVMSLARGDQIYMSRPVYDNARTAMKGGTVDGVGEISWFNHGPFILKGSEEPVEICEVGEDGHAPLTPPEANDKCRPASASREVEVLTAKIVPPSISPKRSVLPMLVAVVLTALVTGAAMWTISRPEPTPAAPPQRFSIVPDIDGTISSIYASLAISPDGSHIAFTPTQDNTRHLYIRSIDQHDVRRIQGTEGAVYPFFSPDGEWVAFFTEPGSRLKKVSIHGGAVLTLCVVSNLPRGGTWTPDNTIIFTPGAADGLRKVSAEGGTPEELTTLDRAQGELGHRWPQILPGGDAVLFTILLTGDLDQGGIAVLSLQTGTIRTLLSGGSYPRYVSSGHVLFSHAGTLMAFPFDLTTMERTGSPVPVVDGMITSSTRGNAAYAISDTGLLVFAPGDASNGAKVPMLWVDRNGQSETLTVPSGNYGFPRISPDGSKIAISILGESGLWDIWVFDRVRETMTRLTFEETNVTPVWTPDGKRILYGHGINSSTTSGVSWKPADGSGPAEDLHAGQRRYPTAISPDGTRVLLNELGGDSGRSILVMSLDGDRTPVPFVEDTPGARNGTFSPDGQWIAYTSTESGRDEVYVKPYPGPGGKWQLSRDGGVNSVWSHDGTKIYFRSGNRVMSVSVTTDPGFSAGTEELVFEGSYQIQIPRNYDLAPDDEHFVMIEELGSEAGALTFRVVTNWFTELERLVPTGGK